MKTNTIAAISTPLNTSGIGIVRMSGEDAVRIADRVFRRAGGGTLAEADTHTIHYGYIYDGQDRIDEVLVMLMRAPRSFTAEDTVEINCHGGVYVLRRVLQTLLSHGASPAGPGEFTKRAFLNGRIDLSQAEAVMDLIQAQSRLAAETSLAQIDGEISRCIRSLREQILEEIARIEASLDDPEHLSLDGYGEYLEKKLEEMSETCERLLRGFRSGRIIREGIRTVILGRPNAGKSSVMNRILGEERAIVTEIAGTTRDTLEEAVRVGGFHLNIIDTAGIRETDDRIEKIGIERALEKAGTADVILYVIDGTEGSKEEDIRFLKTLDPKKVLVLWNKTDRGGAAENLSGKQVFPGYRTVLFSAVTGAGLEELIDLLQKMFYDGDVDFRKTPCVTNERHADELRRAAESLNLVKESIRRKLPEDFYSIDLMNAYASLGRILGEEVGEDLIDEIFAKFCVGK